MTAVGGVAGAAVTLEMVVAAEKGTFSVEAPVVAERQEAGAVAGPTQARPTQTRTPVEARRARQTPQAAAEEAGLPAPEAWVGGRPQSAA
jgi:hypothetical protein